MTSSPKTTIMIAADPTLCVADNDLEQSTMNTATSTVEQRECETLDKIQAMVNKCATDAQHDGYKVQNQQQQEQPQEEVRRHSRQQTRAIWKERARGRTRRTSASPASHPQSYTHPHLMLNYAQQQQQQRRGTLSHVYDLHQQQLKQHRRLSFVDRLQHWRDKVMRTGVAAATKPPPLPPQSHRLNNSMFNNNNDNTSTNYSNNNDYITNPQMYSSAATKLPLDELAYLAHDDETEQPLADHVDSSMLSQSWSAHAISIPTLAVYEPTPRASRGKSISPRNRSSNHLEVVSSTSSTSTYTPTDAFKRLTNIQVLHLRKSWKHINNKGLLVNMARIFHKMESRSEAVKVSFNPSAKKQNQNQANLNLAQMEAVLSSEAMKEVRSNCFLLNPAQEQPLDDSVTDRSGNAAPWPKVATVNDHAKYLIQFFDELITSFTNTAAKGATTTDTANMCWNQTFALRLMEIGRKHSKLRASANVRAATWDHFGDCAVETMIYLDGVRQQKECVRAWRILIAAMTDELRAGFEIGCRRRASYNDQMMKQQNAQVVHEFKQQQRIERSMNQRRHSPALVQDFLFGAEPMYRGRALSVNPIPYTETDIATDL